MCGPARLSTEVRNGVNNRSRAAPPKVRFPSMRPGDYLRSNIGNGHEERLPPSRLSGRRRFQNRSMVVDEQADVGFWVRLLATHCGGDGAHENNGSASLWSPEPSEAKPGRPL